MEKETVYNPSISVIIPVYNTGILVYRMIKCLEQQTFQNFEVILVNDGSTDDSQNICEKIVRNKPNYFLFAQNNQGAFAARNLGLEKSKGQYIAFLDADDVIDENYLEVLFKYCRHAEIAVCDVSVYKKNMESFRFTSSDSRITQSQALNKLLIRQEINSGPCGKLFQRKIIQDIKFPPLRVYEDILFVMKAFCKSKQIAITNETTYYYIQEDTGTMGNNRKSPSLDIVTATAEIMKFITSRSDLEAKCFYITISHLFQYALPLTISNQYKECEFTCETRKLYTKYMKQILKCSAIPWKEKVLFYLYAHNWIYTDGRIKKIKGR